MLAEWLQRRWYETRPAPLLLRPLAALFSRIAASRRLKHSANAWRSPVPVVVVGNIAVGGTGKTPLVVKLLSALQEAGYAPAVISRGYGGSAQGVVVVTDQSAAEVGDEPFLIAKRSGCPVAIGSQRVDVIQTLLAAHPTVNVIISDDGLQHYRMARDVECVVIDGARGLGNQSCLPAGPLREPPQRLEEISQIVANGELQRPLPEYLDLSAVKFTRMALAASHAVNLVTGESILLDSFEGQTVHAVAGIGNPQRFFQTLAAFGVTANEHAFADHHPYTAQDLDFSDTLPVLMTEKDAVKCSGFARDNWWSVPVDAKLDGPLVEFLIETLQCKISK